MAAEPINSELAVKALAVLTAIPVVVFALWADSFGRHLNRLAETEPKYDKNSELSKVKIAGVFALLFQIALFAGSADIRAAYPVISMVLLITAIVIQGVIQGGVERKLQIHAKAQPNPPKNPGEQLEQASRAIFWSMAAATLYVIILLSTVKVFSLFADAISTSQVARNAIVIIGAVVGVLAGLIVNFALGPFHLRKILPVAPLEDPNLRDIFEGCFRRADLNTPSLWVINSNKSRFDSTIVAGFRWLKPALFVSRAAIAGLTPSEFQAIIFCEVSHMSLRHLRKRFFLSFALIVGTTFVATFVVLLVNALLPGAQSIAGPVAALFALVYTFKTLARQNMRHELLADIHTIEKFGASIEDISSALVKLDFLNELAHDPSRGHPLTEARIRRLHSYFAAKNRARESVEDTNERKAA